MFTQAGYNPAGRVICHAVISRVRRSWRRPASLVRFRCGDLAWRGDRGVSWPEQIRITSHPRMPMHGDFELLLHCNLP